MLILGRRTNQSIVFPHCGITVRILDVNGRVAKIGIEAPRSVEIIRGELALSSPGSHAGHAASVSSAASYEQNIAPERELPVLQFAQRLADLRTSLHVFQQRRAVGDEMGADQVLANLLSDMAQLDSDWLSGVSDRSNTACGLDSANPEFVSEPKNYYEIGRPSKTIQILVVSEPGDSNGFALPAGTFHGCQVCTVTNHQSALDAIRSTEKFDYVVCDGGPMAFDELGLVRTIRSNRQLDDTKVFMTSVAPNPLEQLELSNSYRIDGWLARPLSPQNLWKHIVESEQIEV